MINYKHATSEILVALVHRMEQGAITKTQVFTVLDSLEAISIDDTQRAFFGAYRKLVEKVDAKVYND